MATADPLECAICFESIETSTSLPCACKVDYCMRCWDRALAQSFQSCGKARCPTCRGHIRVELDADKTPCGLVFSREEDEVSKEESLQKLLKQARPVQVKLLRQYGDGQPELQELSIDANAIAERWASGSTTAPPCVCGDSLQRIAGEDRAKACVVNCIAGVTLVPGTSDFDRVYEILTKDGMTGVQCDICGSQIPLGAYVWTCKCDIATIFHATSYDCCDRCFLEHVGSTVVPEIPKTLEESAVET